MSLGSFCTLFTHDNGKFMVVVFFDSLEIIKDTVMQIIQQQIKRSFNKTQKFHSHS